MKTIHASNIVDVDISNVAEDVKKAFCQKTGSDT